MAHSDTQPAPTKKPLIPKVPWTPLVGLTFVFVVFYISQLLSSIIIEIYPITQHWSKERTLQWLNDSVPAQFVFILIAQGIAVGAIYWFLKRRYKLNLSAIGLKRPTPMDPVYGIAAVVPYFIVYAIAVGVISSLIPSFNADQQQEIGFSSVHGGLNLTLTFLSLVVIPPLAEEIIVRGFLFSTLKKALPTIYAALLTSMIFGAAHLQEGGDAGLLWIGAVDTFILSLFLIYLRVKTGSLWASITLHAAKNGIAFMTLFVLAGR